jgi:hypothetical protein
MVGQLSTADKRKSVEKQKLKLSSVATLVTKTADEAIMVPTVGSGGVRIWRESGVRLSVSTAVKLFSFSWQEF